MRGSFSRMMPEADVEHIEGCSAGDLDRARDHQPQSRSTVARLTEIL